MAPAISSVVVIRSNIVRIVLRPGQRHVATPLVVRRARLPPSTLPKIEDAGRRYLSPDKITQLADTIHPIHKALVITAAYAGCRIGELIALDTDRHQPDKRIIRIERSLSEVRGHLRFGQPRTAAARRAVSLPSWLPAVDDSVAQPMRFCDLLHSSHAALFIAQGTHPAVIASRVGRPSVKIVLDVYGHPYEGLDRNAADTPDPPWDRSDVYAMWTRRIRDNDQGRGLA